MKTTDVKTGIIEVRRTSLYKHKRKEMIKTIPFENTPMYISLKLGRTIPQPYGHYAKTEVMISMPCYVEEMKEVYEEITAKANELLKEQVSSIEAENEAIEKRIEEI